MNIQDWFPLELTGLIFLLSKGLSRVFSNTTVQKHLIFSSLPYGPTLTSSMTTGKTIALTILTSLIAQLVKNLSAMQETWFYAWVRKICWRRDRLPTPVFWPGEFHGLYSPATATAKSLQSCPTLCDPTDSSPPGSLVPGILQARTLEWVTIAFSNAWKWKVKVKLLSRVWLLATAWTAPTRLLHPWDLPGKSTGVGCHCLLYCIVHGVTKSRTWLSDFYFHLCQ